MSALRQMFTPSEDVDLMKRVSALMQSKSADRKDEDDETRVELKRLASKLTAARQSAQRPVNVPSAAAHAQTISRLDDKRFALVKAIEEAEGALNGKEAETRGLKSELKDLEEKDIQEDHELDGTAVRLSLYRDLGFQWVEAAADSPANILIRTASGDIFTIAVDGSLSDFDLANKLWSLNSL